MQEKVPPKNLIDDPLRSTAKAKQEADPQALLFPDLLYDFNGVPKGADKTCGRSAAGGGLGVCNNLRRGPG
jgi:hypothetical protein